MGLSMNFERLDDFISQAKNISIKRIFYNVTQQSIKTMLQSGDKQFEGSKVIHTLNLSALSDDGKTYMTYNQVLGDMLVASITPKEEVAAFNAKTNEYMQTQFLPKMQNDYASADLKAGSCVPTVA